MNIKNTEKLFKDFPILYRGHKKSLQQSLMAFGFEHSDGWFNLIYTLSEKLTKFKDVEVAQVKEKYGSLRYYVNGGNEEVEDLIEKAELQSETTCEICGKEGKIKEFCGWFKCRCEEHKEI